MSMNEKKTLVCVTVMVAVFVREGAEADDATLMLAADTAARLGDDRAHAETIRAQVLFRDRRIVAGAGRGAEIGSRRTEVEHAYDNVDGVRAGVRDVPAGGVQRGEGAAGGAGADGDRRAEVGGR